MTRPPTIEVTCDSPNCRASILVFMTPLAGHPTAWDTRGMESRIRARGWVTRGGQEWCEEHARGEDRTE